MYNTVAKICIFCLICEVMELASSLPLKQPISDFHSKIRIKRSPNNFSLFGYQLPFSVSNPSEKITNALSNFRDIFVTERKHVGTPSEHGFYDLRVKSNKKHNETHIMSLVDGESTNKMPEKIKPIQVENHNFSEYHIDKKLIDDIFKDLMSDNIQSENLNNIIQENSEKIIEEQLKRILKVTRNNNSIEERKSTTDPNVSTANDNTETNEYETTTTDDFLRINPSLVASLLG